MHPTTYTEAWFTKRFMFAMVIFLLLIALQTFAIELITMATWLKVVVTLLPIVPLLWAFYIYRIRFRALDEYMRRLTGEAFLWAIGLIGFASFAYGMLAFKFNLPEVSVAFVLPTIFGAHGLILQILITRDNHAE
jgi:hypothetical protein